MADDGKQGAAVDTSAQALLKHIEGKVIGDMFDEPEPIEPVKDDSVKEQTPEEEPKEEPKEETPEETKEPEPEKDKVQKRIDELVARAKTAEEELQAAKSQLEKGPVKEYIPAPTQDNPLSDVMSMDDLRKREQIAEQVRANCLRNPEGYSVLDKDGKEVFFDAATVREALVETDKLLRKDIPNRAKWLENHNSSVEQTKKVMPWLFDGRTAEYQTKQTILNNFPDIKKLPQYEYFVGLAILGEKTLNEQISKSKAKPAENKKVPTPPVAASTSSTKTQSSPQNTTPKPTRGSSRADIERYIAETMLKDYK